MKDSHVLLRYSSSTLTNYFISLPRILSILSSKLNHSLNIFKRRGLSKRVWFIGFIEIQFVQIETKMLSVCKVGILKLCYWDK